MSDFAAVAWDSRKTCPDCHRYMMTDGDYLLCGCGHAVKVSDYDPASVNISLNVDPIVVRVSHDTE